MQHRHIKLFNLALRLSNAALTLAMAIGVVQPNVQPARAVLGFMVVVGVEVEKQLEHREKRAQQQQSKG